MNMLMLLFTTIDTSDVQSVNNAAVVGESTVDIHCWFIHGSDALGCKVVLVSNCSISRSKMYAFKQLTLTDNISCYH